MSFFISRKLLLIFTLLFSSFSFSQMDFEWASGLSNETPLGGDVVTTDMHVDNNNNTFLAGNFKGAAKFGLPGNDTTILSLGGDDVFVAKFDPLGNLLFAHRIGGPLNDKCVAISLDTIGNICISGYYTGTVDFDVSSSVVNLVSTASEGFIAKYDANMNHIWSNSIGSNLYESIVDMDVHTNGDVYITGSFADSLDLDPSLSNSYWIYENGYPFDMFLAKYDSNGSFVWGKGIPGIYAYVKGIEVDNIGNPYITGYFEDSISFNSVTNNYHFSQGYRDVFFAKYNSSGTSEWSHTIGSTLFDKGLNLNFDNSNNLYVVGEFYGTINLSTGPIPDMHVSAGGTDAFVAKYLPNGSFVLGEHFGGTGNDSGMEVVIDNSSNIYFSGIFEGTMPVNGTSITLTSNGDDDVFLIKLDGTGTAIQAESFGGSDDDEISSIGLNSNDYLRLTGSFEGTVDFDFSSNVSNLTTPYPLINSYFSEYNPNFDLTYLSQIGSLEAISYNDGVSDIVVDSLGNSYITGYFVNSIDLDGDGPLPTYYANGALSGSQMSFLAKFDPNGSLSWFIPFLSDNYITGTGVTLDDDGDVLVTGQFKGTVDFDASSSIANMTGENNAMFIAKYDSLGNYIWSKNIGAPSTTVFSTSLITDQFGNIFTTGQFYGTVDFDPNAGVSNLTSINSYNVFLLKLNTNGQFLWANQYGTGPSIGTCLTIDDNNNVFVGGFFSGYINFSPVTATQMNSYQGSPDGFFCKIDNNGNHILSKQIGGSDPDYLYGIGVDSEGRITTTGSFRGTVYFEPYPLTPIISNGSNDYFISQYTELGDHRWTRTFGATSDDVGTSLVVDENDNIYTAGYFQYTIYPDPFDLQASWSNSGPYDGFIGKYDANGQLITFNQIGGPELDKFEAIALNGTDVYAGGYFSNGADFDVDGNNFILAAPNSRDLFASKYSQSCNNSSSSEEITACDSYFYAADGNTYTSSGQYFTGLTSSLGCDSSIMLDLTIHPSVTSNESIISCGPYSVPNTGIVYSTTGTYTIDLQTSEGCDSTLILDLIIGESLDQNVAVTACGEFTWDVNGQTYYFTGTHLANFTNQYGCDSTFILDLTILTPPNISISSGGLSLSVPSGALSYQWLDCDANYAPIFGANLHTFSPSYNGFFAVQVSNQNCTDTSACLPITQVGLSDLSLDFSLVPNPTNGAVQLNFGATIDNLTIKVMDASARLLDEYHFDAVTETQLNINGESGVYFIVMEWNYSRIVERVVKTNF